METNHIEPTNLRDPIGDPVLNAFGPVLSVPNERRVRLERSDPPCAKPLEAARHRRSAVLGFLCLFAAFDDVSIGEDRLQRDGSPAGSWYSRIPSLLLLYPDPVVDVMPC
jgi:hypothetical protein